MKKIKRVTARFARLFRRFDRSILRGFQRFFRLLYKIKFFRPLLRPMYRFVHAHYRFTASFLTILIIASIATPVLQRYYTTQKYVLNAQAQSLLGKADPDLTKKLNFNAQKQTYEFNKEAKSQSKPEGNPMTNLKSQIGGAGKDDEQLYSMDAPRDLSKGVTYYDNQMDLNFKITPQFGTLPAEIQEGHLVYPLIGSSGQVAYTVEATGLKQNVVLYSSPGDALNMSYKLDLPKSLEARLDDETGNVGIYSADPQMLSRIDYQASDAAARFEAARNDSEKTHLTFTIPAPVVMAQGKIDQVSIGSIKSHFLLNDDILTVMTTGLDKAEYPLAIDPTVSIDSASEFGSGTVEDNNLTLDSGNATRNGVSGGGVGAWSGPDYMPGGSGSYRALHSSVAYNGYLYAIGGQTDAGYDQYAPINSDGSLGVWANSTAAKTYTCYAAAAAYNGYVYVVGGSSACGATWDAAVKYSPVNSSTGDLTGWVSAGTLPTGKINLGVVAYQGYLYVLGGYDTATRADVIYAPIKANGSLGSWTSTTSFGTPRYAHQAAAYNGYMYVYGGLNASDVAQATVEYAPIGSDGTVGTWATTTSFTTARHSFRGFAYNGYLYLTGGTASSAGLLDIQYAPINANGTIGSWTATSALSGEGRFRHTAVAYNGYLYIIGGAGSCPSCLRNTIYTAKVIDPGGLAGSSYSSTPNFTTARDQHCSVAYNGYMYVMGGMNASSATINTIQFGAIGTNGNIASWSANGTLPTNRRDFGCAAYNGYMYITGGLTGGATDTNTYYKTINPTTGVLSGSWTTAGATLPSVVGGGTLIMYNGYMYYVGGDYAGGRMVFHNTINSNGSIGASWSNNTLNRFANSRDWGRAFAYNGYMYILGGSNNGSAGTYRNDIEYAQINSDGTLGTWSTLGSTLPNVRESFGITVHNGYVYVCAGFGMTSGGVQTLYSDMQYSPINANGTLGSWTSTVSIGGGNRQNNTLASYNGYIYSIGGEVSGSGRAATVQYQAINNGGPGTTGTWTSTSSFTNTRYGHGSVAYNGYMYILGGFNGTSYADIQYAPISGTNGTLSSWSSAGPDFTTARYGLDTFVYDGYIYVLGGTTNGSTYLDDVQYAPINANGTIGSWQTTTSFPTARYGHHVVAYNGYIYLTGGNDNSARNDVQYAPINNGGTLGSWSSAGTFTNARYGHDATINNGYLYIMAGNNNGTYYNDVQVAQIQGNGSLGTWSSLTPFNNVRYGIDSFAYNGYLYVVGGYNGVSYYNDVQYAPIAPNGHIGQWQRTTDFTTARYVHTAVAYNGYMYVLGGNSGSYLNNVYYAPMNVMSRKATYSKVLSFGSQSKMTGVNYTGNLIDGLQNIRYRFANSAGTFPTTAPRGADLPFTCDAGTHVQVLATLDNTTSSVFPDSSGTRGQISSITVTYDVPGVPTDKRLRHGAHFSSEQLQPFDTRGC